VNTSPEYFLKVAALRKRYGPVTVLKNCNLQVRAGEIHALLGANGAGKSTTVRIIAGLMRPTSGTMRLGGTDYAPVDKRDAELHGVQIVQQELNLISTLSVAENLYLPRLHSFGGVIRRAALHRDARTLLDKFGLNDVSTKTAVGSLGVGLQQMVEIAGALDRECRLLILDEPTAALSAAESVRLFAWLRRLRDAEVAIIYISHRLDEVASLSNRVSVLRDGGSVGTYDVANLSTDRMVSLMSGTDQTNNATNEYQTHSLEQPALSVEGLSGGIVHDVSLHVQRGERLGIAGLVGSGRTEFLRIVFGADRAGSGCVYVGDDPAPRQFRHPCEAVDSGIALVTEDRKDNGLLLSHSIRANTTVAALAQQFSTGGVVRQTAEEEAANSICQALETQYNDIEQTVATLSGGNQQKIAVAKWLIHDADVFLFDEPTRGIDIPARRRLYRLFDSLASDGKGLIIVSSDLSELLETCDRIAVMSNGRIAATFERSDWSHERIMQAAFSGYQDRNSK
jgi:ribose transport system ATP-binding protein